MPKGLMSYHMSSKKTTTSKSYTKCKYVVHVKVEFQKLHYLWARADGAAEEITETCEWFSSRIGEQVYI